VWKHWKNKLFGKFSLCNADHLIMRARYWAPHFCFYKYWPTARSMLIHWMFNNIDPFAFSYTACWTTSEQATDQWLSIIRTVMRKSSYNHWSVACSVSTSSGSMFIITGMRCSLFSLLFLIRWSALLQTNLQNRILHLYKFKFDFFSIITRSFFEGDNYWNHNTKKASFIHVEY